MSTTYHREGETEYLGHYDRRTSEFKGPSNEDEFLARRLEQIAMDRPDHRGFLLDMAQRLRDLSATIERLRGRRRG